MHFPALHRLSPVHSLLAGTAGGGGAIGSPYGFGAGCWSYWREICKRIGAGRPLAAGAVCSRAQLAASRAVRSLKCPRFVLAAPVAKPGWREPGFELGCSK